MVYRSTVDSVEYDTYILLRQTCELLDKVFSRKCQLNGLTSSAVDVLYTVLATDKPMSAYKLARILGREHHSVVEIVNRLKRKGLITRDGTDRRAALKVTDAGKEALRKMLSTRVMLPLFQAVGPENLKKLKEALMPLRTQAMRDLGLIDLGELRFTTADDVARKVS